MNDLDMRVSRVSSLREDLRKRRTPKFCSLLINTTHRTYSVVEHELGPSGDDISVRRSSGHCADSVETPSCPPRTHNDAFFSLDCNCWVDRHIHKAPHLLLFRLRQTGCQARDPCSGNDLWR